MKRPIRTLKRIILFFLLTIFMLLCIINTPWFFVSSTTSSTDYSNWMSENLTFDQKVIDIAMLGAHDAFSSKIDIFSPVYNNSADGLMQGFTGRLIKGFSIRQSKTQVVGAEELLKSGVRYLDIRLSFNSEKEEYYTVHNYFSSPLTEVLSEINLFLEENPGEFLILDIQRVYGADYSDNENFDEIYNYFDETQILDYAYQNNVKDLNDISYGDITENSNTSGVLIFSKFETSSNLFWSYDDHIRSAWANEDEFSKIIDFLEEEKETIQNNLIYQNNLRIMQAVATMEMSLPGILRSFEEWSLLGRARSFNQYLLDYDNLTFLLESMPIMMIDFASDREIIDQFMDMIIEFDT